jgi:hypothetical protein
LSRLGSQKRRRIIMRAGMFVAKFAAAAGLLCAATSLAAPNLISNGSFEADGMVDYVGGVLPPVTSWSVTGQRLFIYGGEGTADGSYAAVFDNGLASSNPPSGTHSAKISQNITVTPNTAYPIFFNYGVFPTSSTSDQKIRTQAGSLDITDTVKVGGTAGVGSLRLYRHVFTAGPSGTETVSFKDATTNGEIGSADGVLDNVRVAPEQVVWHQSFESAEPVNYTITSGNANPAHANIGADPGYNGQATDGTQFISFNGGGTGKLRGQRDHHLHRVPHPAEQHRAHLHRFRHVGILRRPEHQDRATRRGDRPPVVHLQRQRQYDRDRGYTRSTPTRSRTRRRRDQQQIADHRHIGRRDAGQRHGARQHHGDAAGAGRGAGRRAAARGPACSPTLAPTVYKHHIGGPLMRSRIRVMGEFAAGIVLLFAAAQPSRANVIANGSFEADGTVYYNNSGVLPPSQAGA